jgi:hypothetical protein
MAISSGQITVGTTAVQVDGTFNSMWRIHIHNNDNTDTLFIGGSDVTTSNGLQLPKLDSIELQMNAGDTVWVLSSKAGHAMSWLKQV